MAGSVISNALVPDLVSNADRTSLQLLANVPDSRGELICCNNKFIIFCKEMCIANKHCPTPACVGDNWTTLFESFDVLTCDFLCSVEITGMSVQCAATHLICRSLHQKTICSSDSRRCSINARKESFTEHP